MTQLTLDIAERGAVPLEDRPVERPRSGHRHLLRSGAVWAVAVLVAVYAVSVVATNPAMRWNSIGKFLTAPIILQGLLTTLLITFLSAVIGLVGGLLIALMRMTASR